MSAGRKTAVRVKSLDVEAVYADVRGVNCGLREALSGAAGSQRRRKAWRAAPGQKSAASARARRRSDKIRPDVLRDESVLRFEVGTR